MDMTGDAEWHREWLADETQTVTSLFAQENPALVERLVLLHPVRNLPDAAKEGMRARASAASSSEGLAGIANAVASAGVASASRSNSSVTSFIRDLVSTTSPEGYAAACNALATAPSVDAAKTPVPVYLIGGAEDYLAGPAQVEAWAKEAKQGRGVVLPRVGHWGGIEAPHAVANAVQQALAPESYELFVGTFRSPKLYTVRFEPGSKKLSLQTTNEALSGHNWLDVSRDGKTLYATCWGTGAARVTCYDIVSPGKQSYHTAVQASTAPSKFMSGYVVANKKAMYSACGPQVDVFELDEQGKLKTGEAVQSFALVSENGRHKGDSVLDFGGLRHGGHSADLSPDGSKLYVADIGRNCVWMYHVDQATGHLKEASKNIAKRGHDGPRHAWPHPNGRIVYSLQEHSSYVDVLRLSDDDQSLEWVEGGNILPADDDCQLYWADEVRLSPDAKVVFGSTRGLKPETKGWVSAWALDENGRLKVADEQPQHRFQTRTSGGWANAIAVAPNMGPNGESYIALTDSEEGFVQMLSYTQEKGFEVLDELKLGDKGEEHPVSVVAWL